MGKKNKPSKSSPKVPKHEKKPQIHNLNRIVRPKVFITESSNFKSLVQELTGNAASPVSTPFLDSSSFDSSCFSTPLEASPECFTYPSHDFSSQFMDLESLLMGIDGCDNHHDNHHDSCTYGMGMAMTQQEVCVYDYDISALL